MSKIYNKNTVPAYDDGKYLGNLTPQEIRDYQEVKCQENYITKAQCLREIKKISDLQSLELV